MALWCMLPWFTLACREKSGSHVTGGDQARDPRVVMSECVIFPSSIHYETMDSVHVTYCLYDVNHHGVEGASAPVSVSGGRLTGSQITDANGCIGLWWWPPHVTGHPCLYFALGINFDLGPDSVCIEVQP